MLIPVPFVGVRYDATRVDLARVVGLHDSGVVTDPRHVGHLVPSASAVSPSPLQVRRAALFAAELLRAQVLVPDAVPAVTVVTTAVDGVVLRAVVAVARTGIADGSVRPVLSPPTATLQVEPWLVAMRGASERVERVLAGETDREPDATFVRKDRTFEIFVVDDEAFVARLASALDDAERVGEGQRWDEAVAADAGEEHLAIFTTQPAAFPWREIVGIAMCPAQHAAAQPS